MGIKILVVTHKNFDFPLSSRETKEIYKPILVGNHDLKINYENFYLDNSGENIANKNKNYCELTAQYWAYKNLSADIFGLVHYRRYFFSSDKKSILSSSEIKDIIKSDEVIVPKAEFLWGDTVWSHYERNHHINDLIVVRKIIRNNYPEYLYDFDKVMNNRKLYMYNMFIMNKFDFKEYSDWLFSILKKCECEIYENISDYDSYQERVFGFLSERLLNVWLLHNNKKIIEIPVEYTDPMSFIDSIELAVKRFKMILKNTILYKKTEYNPHEIEGME